jgi:hypothetical protein
MSEISEACGGGDAGRPLVPGSLQGYRTWRPVSRYARVGDGLLPLTSVTRRHVLWSRVLAADCISDDPAGAGLDPSESTHRAPQPGCKCGIYAWYAPHDTAMLTARVFGVVRASGLVLMGDRGFRAERMEITAIVTRKRHVAEACARQGIAVYRRRRDLLRDHPPEDPTSLIGERPAPAEKDDRPRGAPQSPFAGFDRALIAAVWARTAVVLLAAFLLPLAAMLFATFMAELGLIALILTRVRSI